MCIYRERCAQNATEAKGGGVTKGWGTLCETSVSLESIVCSLETRC